MKFLIINADDVGFSGAINEATEACYRDGKITGVSVMACGPCFSQAVSMLLGIPKKDVGVHLTLTGEMASCTEDRTEVATLINENGTFPSGYQKFAARYFFGKIDFGQVYLELSNQIKKVREAGLTITHLDSHEHVHMFPGILGLSIKLAREFSIPYIRFPMESSGVMFKQFSVKDLARHVFLTVFTRGRKKRISGAGLKCNDTFWGHFHAGRINHDIFYFILDNLREGINEIAFHPGISSEEPAREHPWYRNAEKEFSLLMNEDWKGRLETSGARLVSHKEIVAG